jgi:hypothetical protein
MTISGSRPASIRQPMCMYSGAGASITGPGAFADYEPKNAPRLLCRSAKQPRPLSWTRKDDCQRGLGIQRSDNDLHVSGSISLAI